MFNQYECGGIGMKICPNCNAVSDDSAKFCVKCGSVLPAAPVSAPAQEIPVSAPAQEVPVSAPAQEAPVYTPAPETPVYAPAPGAPTNNPAPGAAPKKKSVVKIALILAVAAIALYLVISKVLFLINPAAALLSGIKSIYSLEKSTVTSTISVDYSGDDDDMDTLNDITIKMVSAADIKNLIAEVSLEALYSNKSVVKIAAGVNNEYLYIDPLKLYNKKFYTELEEVLPDSEDYINDLKIIMNAVSGIDIKLDAGKYAGAVKKALGSKLKGSFGKVTVKLDQEVLLKFALAVLEKAEKDDALIESIRTGAIKAINQIIKDKKFEEAFIDKDDLEELLETFEDKKEFKESFKDAIADAIEELEYELEYIEDYEPDEPFEMTLTFRFNLFNKLTGVDCVMEGEVDDGTMRITVTNDIRGGAGFTNINTKDAIDIQELASDYDEQEEVVGEILNNLIKSVKSNKELTKKIEDITGEDLDDIEDLDDLQDLIGGRRLPAM